MANQAASACGVSINEIGRAVWFGLVCSGLAAPCCPAPIVASAPILARLCPADMDIATVTVTATATATLAVPIVPQASALPALSRGEASGQSAAWDLRENILTMAAGPRTLQLTPAQIPTPLYINAPFWHIFSPCHSISFPLPLCPLVRVVADTFDRHHGRR